MRKKGSRSVVKKAGEIANKSVSSEISKLKKVGSSVIDLATKTSVQKIRYIIELLPRFLTLLIRLSRARDTDSKLKLAIIGSILTISGFLGVQISGISRWFWMAVFAGLFGPISALTAAVAVETINAALVVFLVLVTFSICLEVAGSEAVKELAKELFGEEEGASFFETLDSLQKKMNPIISPMVAPLRGFFRFVGGKYESRKDRSPLEVTVEDASVAAQELLGELNGGESSDGDRH